MLLRDKVLVEKCINTLMWDYNRDSTCDINAKQDLQLAIFEFLAVNTREQVEYGIEYMYKEYRKEYEMLLPIILEYQTNGFTESLKDLSPDAIDHCDVVITIPADNIWDKIKSFVTSPFKKKETITQELNEPLPMEMPIKKWNGRVE